LCPTSTSHNTPYTYTAAAAAAAAPAPAAFAPLALGPLPGLSPLAPPTAPSQLAHLLSASRLSPLGRSLAQRLSALQRPAAQAQAGHHLLYNGSLELTAPLGPVSWGRAAGPRGPELGVEAGGLGQPGARNRGTRGVPGAEPTRAGAPILHTVCSFVEIL
jgi:hypothetical protein